MPYKRQERIASSFPLMAAALVCLPVGHKSGSAAVTIKGFELLGADSKISTVQKLRGALESAGVQFIDADDDGGPAVRLRADKAG